MLRWLVGWIRDYWPLLGIIVAIVMTLAGGIVNQPILIFTGITLVVGILGYLFSMIIKD